MDPALSASPTIGRRVESRFRAHPLLRNAHQQTIAPLLFRRMPVLDLRIERLETPDGDFVDLGWVDRRHPVGPIAVLLHGLGGGFSSLYLRGLALRLEALGWRALLLQLRGAGEEPNRLPRSYHHGDTADLRWIWQRLRAAEPATPIASVGWSMGGNILLRALAEEGEQAPLCAAVAASVPFRLLECAEHLDRGFARVYQRHLLTGLKDIVRRKHAAWPLPPSVNVGRVLASRNFFEFDDAFTAPLNGFADAADYYRRTACGEVLDQVRTPTLIVHAEDDPFMPRGIMPSASQLSPSVTLEVAERGGHVGFVASDRYGRADWWLERRIAAHLQQSLPTAAATA